MEAMKSSEQQPMEGNVEVDEFFVGGKDDKVKGRKQGKKKLIAVAVEKKGKGASRIYAKVVESASKEQLWPLIAAHVSKDAHIKTDKWAVYKGLEKEYPNHTKELSNNGSNFDTLHRCIIMIKAWLRGLQHNVQDLQPHLDEYNYRYNRN